MPPASPAIPEHRRQTLALTVVGTAAAASIAAAILVTANEGLRTSLGGLRISVTEPLRVLALGAALSVVLAGAAWRWRRLPWCRAAGWLIVVSAIAWLLGRRGGGPDWPIGDGALLELYTMSALEGHQLLGAYSQFGWHHPGPLPFYWFAPFYWLSGYSSLGMATAVVVSNVASVAIAARSLAKARDLSLTSLVALFVLLTAYVVRLPGLMTSYWNPHFPILPLFALVTLTAAGAAGDRRALPLALIVGSFIVQAHVGLAIVVAAMCGALLVRLGVDWWRRPEERLRLQWRAALMVFLLQILWLPPLAEQIVSTPGNMTRLWRFFVSAGSAQTLSTSWQAWGATLGTSVRSDIAIPAGVAFQPPATAWPAAIGVVACVALVPLAFMAWRQNRPFTCALASVCLLVSVAGFYSVTRVNTSLGDYHIFWLSIVGVVNLSLVIGELMSLALPAVITRSRPALAAPMAVAGVIVVGGLGAWPLIHPTGNDAPSPPALATIFQQTVDRLPATGNRYPVVQFENPLWGEAAGFVLQAKRRGMSVAVVPKETWLFGEDLALTGREDILLNITGTEGHRSLTGRAGNITLAEAGGLFVDAVSLVDHPELRQTF